jgi:hypothetical protein
MTIETWIWAARHPRATKNVRPPPGFDFAEMDQMGETGHKKTSGF